MSTGTTRTTRSEQTRARLVAAARETFVEQGYRATSLRDVAAAAGLSHPGLLRHFGTKDLLLTAVMEGFEEENERALLETTAAFDPGILPYATVARHNAEMPGYLALFAALVGEGSAHAHPAHDWMRERYARFRQLSVDAMADAIGHGAVAHDRDPVDESVRLAAAWDGLQVLEQYLPERVRVTPFLERHQELLVEPLGWHERDGEPAAAAAPIPPMPVLGEDFRVREAGYRTGRERRQRILADAMTLFAREGYADTSLREIAEAVGVSKSTLLHHYPSKEELLGAVLAERDRQISQRADVIVTTRAADALRALPGGAAENAVIEAGLIEVYAVLSCEAIPADHPAHDYFARRYRLVIDHFSALFAAAQADGDLSAHRDPEHEAIWLVALWDGLQYQWLYDRDAVDVATQLERHLADVLPPR